MLAVLAPTAGAPGQKAPEANPETHSNPQTRALGHSEVPRDVPQGLPGSIHRTCKVNAVRLGPMAKLLQNAPAHRPALCGETSRPSCGA